MKLWKMIPIVALAAATTFVAPATDVDAQPRVRVVVPIGPPPPPVVVVPTAPYPGAVWGDGYYRWDGHHHVWRDGRWHRGRPGFHRAPRGWSHSGGGWVRVPGGWVRD